MDSWPIDLWCPGLKHLYLHVSSWLSAQTYLPFWKNQTLTNMEFYNRVETSSMIYTTSDGFYLLIIDQRQGWVHPDPGHIDLNWCPGWFEALTDVYLLGLVAKTDLYSNLARNSSMIHTTSHGHLPILDQPQGWVHPNPGHIDPTWCPGWKHLYLHT